MTPNEKAGDRNAVAAPDLEPGSCNASFRAEEAPRLSTPCRISFHSIRHRLADIDGLCGKAVLDGIVLLGVLPDDSPKFVAEVAHSQIKGNKTEIEKTIITLEYTPNEEPAFKLN